MPLIWPIVWWLSSTNSSAFSGRYSNKRRRRLARHAAGQEAASNSRSPRRLPVAAIISRSKLVRCSSRCASSSLPSITSSLQPLGELELDRLHRLLQRRPGRDVMRVGVDADIVEARDLLAGQRIELDDLLDIVAEERHAPRGILIVRREDFERVALHAEIAALERGVVALVLERDELADDLALVDDLALLQVEDHRRIGLDRSDAVQARHRRDDDHVVALEQRAGRRMAHPVDRLVDRAFLLDVGVGPRHVRLGLVIIVVADEIFDRVVREERLELAVELRGEDLVRRQDQRGALQRLDHLGHREGLARSGDAEQHLVALARQRRLDQFLDRGRLVARRRIVADELERACRPRALAGRSGRWGTNDCPVSGSARLVRIWIAISTQYGM